MNGANAMEYAYIFTGIDVVAVAAVFAAARDIKADAVADESGAVLRVHLPNKPKYEDWDIAELIGPDPQTESENTGFSEETCPATELVTYLTQTIAGEMVLVRTHLAEETGAEEGLSGYLQGYLYKNGKIIDEVPAGVVLNFCALEIEDLILGSADISEFDSVVSTDDIDPQQAKFLVEQMLKQAGEPDQKKS